MLRSPLAVMLFVGCLASASSGHQLMATVLFALGATVEALARREP